jgi:hypothetical protein
MAAPGRVTNDPSNYFAFGLQSAKDVDATNFYYLKQLDGTGFDVDVSVSSERVGGVGREIGLRYRTKVTADGTFVQYAQPDFLGRVLYGALGTDTVTPGPSNAALQLYNHSIVSGASLLPYYMCEQNWADETERTGNCMFSDVKLDGEAGKPVKVTVQFVSGGTPHVNATQLVPVREGGQPIMIPGGSVAFIANGSAYGAGGGYGAGASSTQITKWSADIKNSLDDSIQTNALNREDVLWLTADYDVDFTAKYINSALWNVVNYGGGSTVPTGFMESGQFFFNSSTPSGLGVTLLAPFVEVSSIKVNRLDPDGKTMYLDIVASTRNVGSTAIAATVVSTSSGAYSSPAT